MADYLNIAGRIRTTASDGVAMEAHEVKDLNLNKSQQEVNADVQNDLGDRYTKEETYNRDQLNELITTPDVNRVYVIATNLTTAVTDLLPATGSSDTLYNVGNWDGTQYDTTVYSIYGWDGTAYVCLAVRSFIGEVYDISANHPDGQGNPTPYADLTAALGTGGANVPVGIRRGGMSIKFIQGTVQSSDNKYVQFRYMSSSTAVTEFANVNNWQNEVDIVRKTTAIPLVENTDLNDITTFGLYSVSYLISPTIQNSPHNGGGFLIVERTSPTNEMNLKQTFVFGSGIGYERYSYLSGGVRYWTDWISIEVLSEQLKELDTEINYIFDEGLGMIPPINVFNGSLKQNGETVSTATGKVCTFEITGLTYVYITGRQASGGNSAICAFYDSNGSYISNSSVVLSEGNYYDYKVNVPSDAHYIKVCSTNVQIQKPVLCKTRTTTIDILSRTPCEIIESNTDINNIRSVGIYSFSAAISETLTNIPYLGGAYLLVEYCSPTNTNIVKQTLVYGKGRTYTRTGTTNTWTDWISIEVLSEEFDELVKSKEIPTYWESYMNSKIETIDSKNAAIGNNGDSFIFITDIHWPSFNIGNSPKLMKYILEKTSITNIFCGGDVSQSGTLAEERAFKDNISYTQRFFPTAGNHDASEANWYSVFIKPLENFIDTNKKSYFKLDNESQKIRYIFLTTRSKDVALDSDQISFLNAQTNELSSDWTIFVFTHIIWGAAVASESTLPLTTAGNSVIAAVDAAAQNTSATIGAIICGHCHRDYDGVTTGGIKIIGTTCDANGGQAVYDPVTPTRTAGTTSEQCFDVFSIDTNNKKIYTTRIGGNGADREFSY